MSNDAVLLGLSRRPLLARCNAGSVAIQLALLMPCMLLLIFGCVELSRYYFVSEVMANAVREGARAAIVRGAESYAPADEAEITGIVRTHLDLLPDAQAVDIGVVFSPDNSPGSRVTVNASYRFVPTLPLPDELADLEIRQVAVMTISR